MTILITGATGFIGSCIVKELNKMGKTDLILVDNLSKPDKWKNLVGCKFKHLYGKEHIVTVLDPEDNINLIIHLGACTNTLEPDEDYLMCNNYQYSKLLFEWCNVNNCRFIYASSASVYGNGHGPLNAYGFSKLLFDQYVTQSERKPIQCVGLRFTNVYGPGESHKGRMASMVYQAYNQIKENGTVELFNQNRVMRDFVYIKDILSVIKFFIKEKSKSGTFDIGSGTSNSFTKLVKLVSNELYKPVKIEYIYMSKKVKGMYQTFTQADLDKLREVGYDKEMYSLEEGIQDYIREYLIPGKHY